MQSEFERSSFTSGSNPDTSNRTKSRIPSTRRPLEYSRTLSRMNNKSQSEREARGTSASNGTPNNEFFVEHYSAMRKYMSRDSFEEIPHAWRNESLRESAEQEFINQYDCLPSCMVFAPETITIAGTQATDLAESKSLCMAVQVGTVIAGKLDEASKWCHVKILLDEYGAREEKEDSEVCRVAKLRGNTKSLEASCDECWWVRYVKEAMRSFRARRQGQIPGFKSVIAPASRCPIAEEPAVCTALVVAVYTFLEAITDSYTSNAFEKALACHLALKRARGSFELRLADTLISIIGEENMLFLFDARSLSIESCNWPMSQAISAAVQTNTRWHARPIDLSIMESVYPEDVICVVKRLLAEDEGVLGAVAAIREERWQELGELFWENYRSERKCTSSLSDSAAAAVADIMSALQTTEGVLGARILSRRHGASVLVLVQRSCWKRLAGTLSRIKSLRHQHYAVKPSIGATTLYARQDRSSSQARKRSRNPRDEFTSKYHLDDGFEYSQEYHSFEPAKSLSLFLPNDGLL